MNLTGKVAIITGSSRGIGRAIALNLSKNGASVVINYSSDEIGATETLNMIKAAGGYAVMQKWDISDYEACKKAMDFTLNKFGRLDILVNNAGISEIGLFIDYTPEMWSRMLDINVKGMFNMSHLALSAMLKNTDFSSIVNISSIWGNVGASCECIYSATKGAINSFTKALAKEMAPSKIRVNAVAPGVIDTSMNKWLSEEEKKELEEEIPLGYFGRPEDIANTVCFLCSKESEYMTGQILTVDGGFI
ncbi:elongation factor P 5-aminopentanone reductase [Clostridium oryzae]|uniref:Glucose 1-dehydrogenase 2 n=1 Tax=Clostridium oryzae TaxID=1450648 RepID=A0A1V4ID19_9CLOT|nr:SDR family oxidoreductase [Clostridium oryzae]OPJ57535.1 glucose 1-dehydrogenase 2 [Clostridium oryzae]